MLVAVTGATGFLGGYTCRRLANDGHKLRVMVRPAGDRSALDPLEPEVRCGTLDDPAFLAEFVRGCDCLVHAAVDFTVCRDDQIANFERNVLGSLRLMDTCRQSSAQFIFISSGAAHERILDDRPLDENHPLWPGTTYGAYKAAVEAFIPAYHTQFALNACVLRPTAIYGLHLTHLEHSHWMSLVRRVLRGGRVEVRGGSKVVHVEDVAEAVARAVGRCDVAGESYELTDCYIHDREVAGFAKEAAGVDTEIVQTAMPAPKHKIVVVKARRTFDLPLDRGRDGVREYVERLLSILTKN